MADSSNGCAGFRAQANALLRKNLTFQKRNMKENIRLILFPFILCLLLVLLQSLIDRELAKPQHGCGCACIDKNGDGQCEKRVCGIEYSDFHQAHICSVPSPQEWPPLLQIPSLNYRAVRTDVLASTDFPDQSCRSKGSCPAVITFTGNNRSLGKGWASKLFTSSPTSNSSNILYQMAHNTLGSDTATEPSNFLDPSVTRPIYHLQQQCSLNSTTSVSFHIESTEIQTELRCIQGLHLWRNSSSEINDELYKGYHKGNVESQINEIVAAYDISNSNSKKFNMSVWYNSTYRNDFAQSPLSLMRVPRSVNLASNAYLQLLLGSATHMLLEFVKEMPKSETKLKIDLASFLGPLFFTWVILQLFPVILTSLVYEKQQKLRIMMKMHGLGDSPYWMISYAYFLVIASIYMFCFVTFGSLIGLKFFTLNDYTIQFVFYFIYINLQISMAFLLASSFSNVKTATVVGYILVFGTGLLGAFLFQFFVEDTTFPRGWIIVMELYPGFSLYRGLYEFSQYAFSGNSMGTDGMRWENLNESINGMRVVLIIMFVEWFVLLFVSYYVDQVVSEGSSKSPLFFLKKFRKGPLSSPSLRKPSLGRQGSKVFVQMDKPDVVQETEKVEQLLLESTASHAIVSDNLKKVYPSRDGNPEKFAVRGVPLALPQGECFGMLGANGAGKTSFINMMIGLMKPSSGTAYVQGLDIRTQMDEIYTSMGVCPQHDLLWDNLTGREHLIFYGRLKNLQGPALTQAVEESLRSVNLFNGGSADKKAGKYSGGMKRRLSVAISLIGDPKVVYMDEPSTGLDPASRNNLWNVVKRAKQNRAIILTTHSMEEAEHLCDRLGIFVDGSLQCIGNPKELKGRYGGSYVFTVTTSENHEEEVEKLVSNLSPEANKIYHLFGTQKFELPKHEVRISEVFQAVEKAKRSFAVYAWGLADTTLEDVFIKVARGAQDFTTLS